MSKSLKDQGMEEMLVKAVREFTEEFPSLNEIVLEFSDGKEITLKKEITRQDRNNVINAIQSRTENLSTLKKLLNFILNKPEPSVASDKDVSTKK